MDAIGEGLDFSGFLVSAAALMSGGGCGGGGWVMLTGKDGRSDTLTCTLL